MRRMHTDAPSTFCRTSWKSSSEPRGKRGLALLLKFFHRPCGLELRRESLERFQGLRERLTRLLPAPGARQDLAAPSQPSLLARRLVNDPGEPRKSRIV